MSSNEENNDASPDAPAGAPPPASAPEQTTEAPRPPATKTASRFYSRLRRGVLSAAPATTGEAQPSAEGVNPEDAAHMRDNLPVRATMGGDLREYAGPGDEGPRERDRGGDRPERRGRGRDRDRDFGRGGRGERDRDFERGGRDRDRDRDRGDRGERGPRREDRPALPVETTSAQPSASEVQPAPSGEPSAEAQRPTPVAPETAPAAPLAATPPPPAPVEKPRRLRFEDAHPEHSRSTVQEFRPSRDRSYADEAGRTRREQERKGAEKGKPPGLLGWMKSIFAAKPGEPGATEKEAGSPAREFDPRSQGSRPRGEGRGSPSGPGQGQGPGGDGGEQGGRRRRRRRRGGRGRTRGEGGPGGESGGGTD